MSSETALKASARFWFVTTLTGQLLFGFAVASFYGLTAARGDFHPDTSDLDFFVEFEDLGWKGSFKRYMGLKLGLEDLFGRPVDLVELHAVTNRHFIEVATQHRHLLYAA